MFNVRRTHKKSTLIFPVLAHSGPCGSHLTSTLFLVHPSRNWGCASLLMGHCSMSFSLGSSRRYPRTAFLLELGNNQVTRRWPRCRLLGTVGTWRLCPRIQCAATAYARGRGRRKSDHARRMDWLLFHNPTRLSRFRSPFTRVGNTCDQVGGGGGRTGWLAPWPFPSSPRALVSQPLQVLCPRMTPRTMVLRILYAGCQSTQPQVWGFKTTSLGPCKIGCTINPSAMVGGIQLLLVTRVC